MTRAAPQQMPVKHVSASRHDARAVVSQPLMLVLIAVSAGIACDRAVSLSAFWWWNGALAMLVLWGWSIRRGEERRPSCLILLAAFGAAGAWHHVWWNLYAADDLSRYAREQPQPACVEAIALDEPARLPAPPDDPMRTFAAGEMTRLTVAVRQIRDGTKWRAASGRATLLVDGHLLAVHAGDRLQIFAQLGRPRAARNPGEFDFALHARADRKLSELHCDSPDCVVVLQPGSPFNLERQLGKLRSRYVERLVETLPEKQASLAAALLLGERTEAGREQTDPYFLTGLLHLLVVSGLHVGVLASSLYLLLRWTPLSRRMILLTSSTLVIMYALLTGANPPVVRAATVLTIFFVAQYLGRRALAYNSLAAAALIVLALNPADLFRIAPQLSFLAVAVLIWAARQPWSQTRLDPLDRLVLESRPWPVRCWRRCGRSVWQMTLVGALVWLVTLPVVMLRFHLFTPVAIVLGPILGPLVWLALTSGFVMLLVGWLVPPVGWLAGRLCGGSLALMQQLVEAGERLPGSHLWITGPAAWWGIGLYTALAIVWAFPQVSPPRRWGAALLAGWMALGLGCAMVGASREARLECTVIAVDHGCAVLVQLPGGQTILYDAGRLGSPETAVRSISATLWSAGLSRLDAVIISHADADHYNALPELLERFQIGAVYVSPRMFDRQTPPLDKLRTAIAEAGVPLHEIWQNDRLVTADREVQIEVLHPPRQGVSGSDNANSLVLAIEYAGYRILLPGDLETPGLEDVMAELPYDCDVLLAPHHGSRRSDPPGFAAWSTPEWVIISSGHRHDRHIAGSAYRAVGARVLATSDQGAIRVTLRPSELRVEPFRQKVKP